MHDESFSIMCWLSAALRETSRRPPCQRTPSSTKSFTTSGSTPRAVQYSCKESARPQLSSTTEMDSSKKAGKCFKIRSNPLRTDSMARSSFLVASSPQSNQDKPHVKPFWASWLAQPVEMIQSNRSSSPLCPTAPLSKATSWYNLWRCRRTLSKLENSPRSQQ